MAIAQKTGVIEIASISTADKPIDNLLGKQWLLTNNRGGYSSSTIIGCNTSKYHGLLIGSLNPPVNRIMALANCLETITVNGRTSSLSTFEFSNRFAPDGFQQIKRFRRDIGAHFDYQAKDFELTKSVYLSRDTDTVAVVYDFTSVSAAAELILRPFAALRDLHSLQKSGASLYSVELAKGLLISHNAHSGCELFLACPSMNFEKDPQWWFNFVYRDDKQRGQEFTEDLWTPGFYKCTFDAPAKIVLWANVGKQNQAEQIVNADISELCNTLQRHQNNVISTAQATDKIFEALCLAADQFIANCQPATGRTTILAGFPWFADWGRDAFISLPGLLLETGRFEDAKSVLTTFAKAADQGMIPNRFDDYSDTAYFNSIDASLWFINAAFQYLKAADDTETFVRELLPVIRLIIDSYHNGTRFGTHADADGLITAGNQETQLTWMDAKYGGAAFTPRYGKAVEINALWYNALCQLARFFTDRDIRAAKHYHLMADAVETSFCRLFWNNSAGFLNDCILPDGSADASLRPNQIFAVSLPFSPLPPEQQLAVVNTVQKNLLTPFGLRTLNTADSRYKGIYAGQQKQRDEAYHQGTIWAYLMGAFVEAYLKVNDFSGQSRKNAAEFIEPLLRHLTENGCVGQIGEIFDGDPPHKPRGCFAQAWSVAEIIRAYKLINNTY